MYLRDIKFYFNFYFIFILMTGTVKFFIESKGYGFISNDETGKEIFVHVSSLNGLEIKEGDKVTYSEVEGKKGIVAADVQLV